LARQFTSLRNALDADHLRSHRAAQHGRSQPDRAHAGDEYSIAA
jgi:hypothetical protein